MQATNEKKNTTSKMLASGKGIKIGMIAGGTIVAGVMIAYYLRKRNS